LEKQQGGRKMKIEDLDLRELLSFDPKGGVIHFMGQRVLLLDTTVLGLLRKELITTLGTFAARCILTRFGYAHGWRTAQAIKEKLPKTWSSSEGIIGPKFHELQGFAEISSKRSYGAGDQPSVESTWNESYEAEQHLLHLGQSDEVVCWTMTGYASGFVSCTEGRDVYFIEDTCCGKGDAVCHGVGRYKEQWGPEMEPQLAYYRMESFEDMLTDLGANLRCMETRLKKTKEQLAYLEGAEESTQLLMAHSESMQSTVQVAKRVARVDSSVLITGDSGVGKERMARFIHDQSGRSSRAFVAVNCGALTETLLESELFGHAKGSFTGAGKDRVGLFEAATGGTLFLDEIGEVSPAMQVKLLRVLQEQEVRRVGENQSRSIDVRVLAATNRTLTDEIAAGRFRKDLYYRLRVVELRVPPLQQRHEDILPLARFFLSKISAKLGRNLLGFTPRAAGQMLRYEWPGNVRELQNAIEYAVAMSQGTQVDIEDLPSELQAVSLRPIVSDSIRPLHEIERDYILGVLKAVGDDKPRAASQLSIGLTTLYRKLKEYEGQ
jgi:two-component system, NtrC family, response regulator HydG